MKKLLTVLLMSFFLYGTLVGCAGFQIGDNPNSQALGYVSGKGMGLAINKLAPKSAPTLEANWKSMMDRNAALDPIPGSEIILYFNQSVLVLVDEVKDPYGLLGDLAALLTIYGAEFATDGQMLSVGDIPKSVANYFQLGYSSGKQLALK